MHTLEISWTDPVARFSHYYFYFLLISKNIGMLWNFFSLLSDDEQKCHTGFLVANVQSEISKMGLALTLLIDFLNWGGVGNFKEGPIRTLHCIHYLIYPSLTHGRHKGFLRTAEPCFMLVFIFHNFYVKSVSAIIVICYIACSRWVVWCFSKYFF